MEKGLSPGKPSIQKKRILYVLIEVVIFMFAVISGVVEMSSPTEKTIILVFGKWFVFWAFGIRLFTLGIKQASIPSIAFGIDKPDDKIFELFGKLGVANICLGIGGILSLINDEWRQIITIISCLFFGLAMVRCAISELSSTYQKFILIKNGIIFLFLLFYILCILKQF